MKNYISDALNSLAEATRFDSRSSRLQIDQPTVAQHSSLQTVASQHGYHLK